MIKNCVVQEIVMCLSCAFNKCSIRLKSIVKMKQNEHNILEQNIIKYLKVFNRTCNKIGKSITGSRKSVINVAHLHLR